MLARHPRNAIPVLSILVFVLTLTVTLGTLLIVTITPPRVGTALPENLPFAPSTTYPEEDFGPPQRSGIATPAPTAPRPVSALPTTTTYTKPFYLGIPWAQIGGSYLLALVVSAVLGLYLYIAQPPSLTSTRRLALLALVIVSTVLVAKVALPGRPLWAVLFPVAAGSMLLTTLLELSLGLMATLAMSVMAVYVIDTSPEFLVYAPLNPLDSLEKLFLYLITGITACLGVWRARRTSQYFIAGGLSSAAAIIVVTAFWLLAPYHDPGNLGWLLLAAAGNGFLAAALSVGLFFILGVVFEVTTSVQLHELAQTDHPLLKRLLQEAPGTYYHSILVGNLAEQVAEAIGADALVARIGAYYHDIGKVENPGFFIENQRRGENVHDRLHPQTSASIIVAHVTDGMRLAQEHRLPTRIQAFMREHHGTRLATAFYNAATHLDPNVDPELFRYPGPSPRSKETAIVMMADSIEATARSTGVVDPQELDALVDQVISQRVNEGQFDQCDLTFRDVQTARQVFKAGLRGIFHPRIQYPQPADAADAGGMPPENGAAPSAGARAVEPHDAVPRETPSRTA